MAENEEQKGTEGKEGQDDVKGALEKLQTQYAELDSFRGKLGNEIGDLKGELAEARERIASYEAEKEAAQLQAAESSKVQEYDSAVKEVHSGISDIQEKIAGLDVTDPDFTKNLTKLQAQQAELQSTAFQLAEKKGREETLAMAKESFSQELSKRDQAAEEREVQKRIDKFYKDNSDFQEAYDSGALEPYIQNSDGFEDAVSAFRLFKYEQVATKLADAEKRLNLASGEENAGTVITSGGQEIQPKPIEKIGRSPDRSSKMDAGMRAVLQNLRTGTG